VLGSTMPSAAHVGRAKGKKKKLPRATAVPTPKAAPPAAASSGQPRWVAGDVHTHVASGDGGGQGVGETAGGIGDGGGGSGGESVYVPRFNASAVNASSRTDAPPPPARAERQFPGAVQRSSVASRLCTAMRLHATLTFPSTRDPQGAICFSSPYPTICHLHTRYDEAAYLDMCSTSESVVLRWLCACTKWQVRRAGVCLCVHMCEALTHESTSLAHLTSFRKLLTLSRIHVSVLSL
jgi:hypothetical protein